MKNVSVKMEADANPGTGFGDWLRRGHCISGRCRGYRRRTTRAPSLASAADLVADQLVITRLMDEVEREQEVLNATFYRLSRTPETVDRATCWPTWIRPIATLRSWWTRRAAVRTARSGRICAARPRLFDRSRELLDRQEDARSPLAICSFGMRR